MKSIKRNRKTDIQQLYDFAEEINLAEYLEKEVELKTIGNLVVNGYNIDCESRSAFDEENEKIMSLVNQIQQVKNTPWPNAANVKLPIITEASIQFGSRAFPELIPSDQIVKTKKFGVHNNVADDAKVRRGERVQAYMNYQLTEEMPDWIDDMDTLLHVIPALGGAVKKVYYDNVLDRVQSDFLTFKDVVANININSFKTASRITHKRYLDRNAYLENVNAGLWKDDDDIWCGTTPSALLDDDSYAKKKALDNDDPDAFYNELEQDEYFDGEDVSSEQSYDEYGEMVESKQHLFLEQHRYLDLDGDGYMEPYIVTVHNDTGIVVRIVARFNALNVKVEPLEKRSLPANGDITVDDMSDASIAQDDVNPKLRFLRIEPIHHFVKYPFIPNPNGGFYDIGFGRLLLPLNEACNALVNQLLDAGTASNSGGGFLARGIRIKGGVVKTIPGEWVPTGTPAGELKNGIVPFPTQVPSQVLFSLLGLLMESARSVSSVSDAMSGQKPGENVSAPTVMALIEQGMKVFSGIYKRQFRAMSEELQMMYRLNGETLDEKKYFEVVDPAMEGVVGREDFSNKGYDIQPTADPNISMDIQRIARAQGLMALSGRPGMIEDEITKRSILAMKENPQEFMYSKDNPPPQQPPDPKVEEMYAKLDLEKDKLDLEREQFEQEKINSRAKGMLDFAKTDEVRENEKKIEAEREKIMAETKKIEAEAKQVGKESSPWQTKTVDKGK